MTKVTQQELDTAFSKMILSVSGWRKVFAISQDQEDKTSEISDADKLICTAVAKVFHTALSLDKQSRILLARDARPTGSEICSIIYRVLCCLGCKVDYIGIASAPETMALSAMEPYDAFAYVSASHNPIGHNGVKFGSDGGVFGKNIAEPIIEMLKIMISDVDDLYELYAKSSETEVFEDNDIKALALSRYSQFVDYTTCPDGNIEAFIDKIKALKTGIGIVGDFNGSARGASIDKEYLQSLGLKTLFINDRPTVDINHGIIPEGKNLEYVQKALEEAHSKDPAFILGYMPDNDGDRGNIVYIDKKGKAKVLEAQEIFALCVDSTLAYHSEMNEKNLAVSVNGPTSMRIDRIAAKYNAEVFRAEVGEANVVNLSQELSSKGYIVPIMGEGTNGGNITAPAKVRDPMNTLMCLVRLITRPCSLDDAIAQLPVFTTSNTGDPEAILHLKTKDYKSLKAIYEKNLEDEWNSNKKFLSEFGIDSWYEVQTEGTVERKEAGNGDKGGLKICFCNKDKKEVAFVWMRPSGTEPLFRVLADVEGKNKVLHDFLINWQREMILKAQDCLEA